MPLNVSAAPAKQERRKCEYSGICVSFSRSSPSDPTEIVDKDSSDHGAAAAAQTQMETLQDTLGRRPQSRRDRRAQIGDTGGPNRRMCHTWETQADKAESMLPPAEDRTEHLKRVVTQSVHQGV